MLGHSAIHGSCNKENARIHYGIAIFSSMTFQVPQCGVDEHDLGKARALLPRTDLPRSASVVLGSAVGADNTAYQDATSGIIRVSA